MPPNTLPVRPRLQSGIDDQQSTILELLSQGKPEKALAQAEQAVQAEPDNAQLVMLYGIALAQTGRPDEGLGELRRATMLAPDDPETFYNLAVQLYDEGDRVEAAEAARQTLKLDPDHARAQELVEKCGVPGGAPFEADGQEVRPAPESLRAGPDDPLQPVFGLGEPWSYIGYGLFASCLLESVLLVAHNPGAKAGLRTDALSIGIVALCVFNLVFGIFWMTVDLFDRKKKFVWLLPQSAFGLIGLPAIPLALYLLMGRRNTGLLA